MLCGSLSQEHRRMKARKLDVLLGLFQVGAVFRDNQIVISLDNADLIVGWDLMVDLVDKAIGRVLDLCESGAEPAEERRESSRLVGASIGWPNHYDTPEFRGLVVFEHRSYQDAAHAMRHDMEFLPV